ncbi:NUDIX hydrolase [Natronoglycomyces albus]|uniref:NUDIX hydrolase n=1 Tax=Natronoglycomyces albus TaxID=2811108 RepID=A0A895XM21_9ACTN|nr:NUDIX hydrolase [Natronoglycomyces albus]QSB04459.1 NUDIX hydrolase [Natronoglycomyces albus]
MEPARHRVAVYVTRQRQGTTELLVFAHRDYPEAGIQVPAGGVDTNETLHSAATREVREETGIDVSLGEALGVQLLPHPTTGQRRITVFFHATTTQTPSQWTHTVVSDGEDNGLVFECRFIPIEEANLLGGLDEWLHLVPKNLVTN